MRDTREVNHLAEDAIMDEMIENTDIVKLIKSHISSLEKAGPFLRAVCPFCSDKTEAFVVSPKQNLYYCLSCARGGDSLCFLNDWCSKYENRIINVDEAFGVLVHFRKE